MPNTCYMLYILALRAISYHFECCMIFDVVLALLVSTIRAMRRPLWRGTSDRTGSTFLIFVYQKIYNRFCGSQESKLFDYGYSIKTSNCSKD